MTAHVYHAKASSRAGSKVESKKMSKTMRDMLGPGAVDQQIRQAILSCWMMLPEGKKNPDSVAVEISRIVERALANLKEDAAAFGIGRTARRKRG